MSNLFTVTFCLMCLWSEAQENTYRFSKDILCSVHPDTTYFVHQVASWDFAAVGNYHMALAMHDSINNRYGTLAKGDSDYFYQFKTVNALTYIARRAASEKVIIINEAHNQPYHRVFTQLLLDSLYKAGYRYFGVETVGHSDTMLNQRKYPVIKSGPYMAQPQYGNLVRAALQKGFYVFAYETTNLSCTGKEREIDQAQNIKRILDKDTGAKILIHCGYDHLVETEVYQWGKAMAGRLKEFTGIDPFTIDQITLTETGNAQLENPFFKMINLDYYAMFIDSVGHIFKGPQTLNRYDARVYHPRTQWIFGRPNWLFQNNQIPYLIQKPSNLGYPCLVLAYHATEDEKTAVPADVVELNDDSVKALALSPGKYLILIKDTTGLEKRFNITQNP